MHFPTDDAVRRPPTTSIWFIIAMGVMLPGAALLIELVFRISRQAYFDPFPTVLHVALFASVPLANALAARALTRAVPLAGKLALLHGFGTGVALIFAIIYLPLTPFAPLAIPLFGIGFLPLAPLLAFSAALVARHQTLTVSGDTIPHLLAGMGLALAALVLIEAPTTSTRIAMDMATSHKADERVTGVRWLRAIGDEDLMLRFCYPRAQTTGGLTGAALNLKSSYDPNTAREVFFKVTGSTFSSHPAPAMRQQLFDSDGFNAGFDWDRGGDAVGQQTNGARLTSSRMDGSVDANAALGYLEWTMVFNNDSQINQEARAEIALPAGAVVSRATLWINGEAREAAFGGRGQVRQAYESVVKANRDPLLVTTAGPGRVLVQLFPILPGRQMQIRLGMTAPMAMTTLQRASMPLPTFSDRNFTIADSARHAIWIESKTRIEGSAGLHEEQVTPQLFALRGSLAEAGPNQNAARIEATRTHPLQPVWSRDDKRSDGAIIVQTVAEHAVTAPRRAAIVLDGSASLRKLRRQLAETLSTIAPGVELAIMFAGDAEPQVFHHDRADVAATRKFLEGLIFEGGRDNAKALTAAWAWATEVPGSAVVWVHGPQPVAAPDLTMPFEQLHERRRPAVTLYDLQVTPGSNAISRKLEGLVAMQAVPRAGRPVDDLQHLLAQWQAGAKQVTVSRTRQAATPMSNDSLTSPHLTRLWAAAQVDQLAVDPAQRDAAIALASTYQLVTPVSGAVVLETQQQYDAAGLEPVTPGSVPTIPEPETWLMIIVTLIVLVLRRRFRRT
jgi:hypothetical protein